MTAGYDADVVGALRENKARASFFASGKWMQSHPEQAMQLMVDPLFELGGHGWAHENFRLLDRPEAEKRFLRTQAFYEALRREAQRRWGSGENQVTTERIPSLPGIFRFPFGTCNADALEMLAAHGVAAIQWDVVSGDAVKGRTAGGITEVVLKQSKPGSIVIFHANGRGHGTAEALPGLISAFRERGYEFVTVSELLAAGKPVSSSECYELRPGDNRRYDKFK
jgi:peptidoglycan/xylan/chitin deacetylase (PgdA/CDA1 family)